MRKNKFLSDLSIGTVQAILNQFSGIVVFLIISKYLDKNSFGQINWLLAVLMMVFTVLGCGFDQLTVKKTAIGNDPGLLLTTYLFHVLITGISFLGILYLIQLASPAFQKDKSLFFLLSVSQCLAFFSVPFKQIVNGLEKFKLLFVMSSCANVCKVLALLFFVFFQHISLLIIIWVFVFASLAELTVCVIVYRFCLRLPVHLHYNKKRHLALLSESMPQLGIIIFNTAVARFDWILLGILSTALVVADYSFAYRLFEFCTLPLLIIAPVMFPRISRTFTTDAIDKKIQMHESFSMLIRAEIILAVFIALVANICWKSIIDLLTGNKYGGSTGQLIFILSCCMPLLYLNNILWSINFAKGKMRTIFVCVLVTFLINILADVLLIPLFSARGAALGFVIATFVQTFFYCLKTELPGIKSILFPGMLACCMGLASGFLAKYLFHSTLLQVIASCAVYFLLLILSGQLSGKDWLVFKKMTAI